MVIFVAITQPSKSLWVMPDYRSVHGLGNCDLPGIILTHAMGCTALAKGDTLGVLAPNGLPAEGAKCLAHGHNVRCAFEYLGESHR